MRPFFLLALLLLAPRPVHATVVEVPLPGLVGPYWQPGDPAYGGKVTTFTLPSMPSVIHGVSIRVKGTNTFGEWSCDGSQGYHPVAMPTQIDLQMSATAGGWVTGSSPNSALPGAFEWTKTFESVFGGTWGFLLDGTGELTAWGAGEPAIMECNQTGVGATLSVTEATLLVDGEFATPANVSTWGRIKAQYR